MEKLRICLYARVSKALEQNPENQFQPLLDWIQRANHIQVKDNSHFLGIFVDEMSSKDTRPKKEEVLKLIRLGLADGIACVALDRWGRTMSELVFELEEFSRTGISLISLKEGIDLSTSAGRLMANVLASMANFERDRIHERTMLGLDRATAQGKIGGRHPKDCGCGATDKHGKKHDGFIKPIRDASNRAIGWQGLQKQTPPELAPKNEQEVSI